MPEYPQIDNAGGLWKLPEIANYKFGGYWPDVGSRGVFAGGRTPSESNVIDFIEIASTGNATDFGDLQSTKYNMGTGSNGTRGVFFGGYDNYPTQTNVIDTITIDTAGNAADFGNLTVARGSTTGHSNSTRAVASGGGDSSVGHSNVIDFFFMASTGF